MSSEKASVRIGIVGVGGMGSHHARSIREGKVPRAELKALCDIDPSKLQPYRDDGDLKCYADSSELIASGDVDAVVIATPHYDHTTIGIAALEAGLHVLVEKPISVHKADCERLIAAHKDEKQVFSAMFQQRTSGTYRKLRDLIQSGELGTINRINWIVTNWFRSQQYYDSGGWRATWAGEGGGVLLNQCPHQLDLWQWLFGMPVRVRAFCHIARFHKIEVEDDVTAYMEYANGATGVFITTTGEAPGTNRLEIAAERGKVVVEGGKISFRRNRVPSSEFCATSKASFATPEAWDIQVPVGRDGGGHNGILGNFVAAILDGTDLIASAREGIHSVELGNAMLLSSELGRAVDVPIDGGEYQTLLEGKIATSTYVKDDAGGTESSEDDFASSF